MANVVKISIQGLKQLIGEEKQRILKEMKSAKGFGPMGDVTKEAGKTAEVEADEHGTSKVKEKPVDHYKAQKIKEAKLLLQLQKLREEMRQTKQVIARSTKTVATAKRK